MPTIAARERFVQEITAVFRSALWTQRESVSKEKKRNEKKKKKEEFGTIVT